MPDAGAKIRWAAALLAVLGAASVPVIGAHADAPSSPAASAWVTDGPVYAIARSGGRTFIGGAFTRIGPRTGHGVQLTPLGAAEPGKMSPAPGAFPEIVGGSVDAAMSDGAGGWFVGGSFTHVGGLPRSSLAHIEDDGSGGLRVDTDWDVDIDGTVLALSGGATADDANVLYVAGEFGSVGGNVLYRNLIAVDRASGALSSSWNPSPDGPVRAVQVADMTLNIGDPPAPAQVSLIFAGGGFTKISGTANSTLSAVWGPGSGAARAGKAVAGWNLTPPKPTIKALAVGPQVQVDPTTTLRDVFFGGEYNQVDGKSLTLNAETAVAGTAAPTGFTNSRPVACGSCSPTVNSLSLSADGDMLYVGGVFDSFDGQARNNLAAFDLVAGGIRPWDPGPDGPVRGVSPSPAGVYVAGGFENVAGSSRSGLAALTLPVSDAEDDSAALPWDPSPSGGGGRAVGLSADEVFAGGSFTSVGATSRPYLAALDSSGALDSSWAPAAPTAPVRALAAGHDRLYLGGDFAQVSGEARGRLAAVRLADGALDSGWAPKAEPPCSGPGCGSPPAQVTALAVQDSSVYVGGAFASLGGATRSNAGALDSSGAPTAWAPDANGRVGAILPTCGVVYVGGSFTSIGGAQRGRAAALDPASGQATAWDGRADSVVHAIARDQDVVYLGGGFAHAGGSARQRIAALDAGTGAARSWNPGIGFSGAAVRALSLVPGEPALYAGGTFSQIGGASRSNIVAIDRATGAASGWNPGADDSVRALLGDGTALLAGGDFRRLGNQMQHGFGSFGALSADPGPTTCEPPPEPVVEPEPVPPAPEPQPAPAPAPVVEQPRPADPPPVADVLSPLLTKLSVSRRRFRTKTTFRFVLSEPATVRFRFRRTRGKRWIDAGRLRFAAEAGQNRRVFKGQVRLRSGKRWVTRRLVPGSYRVKVWAVDAVGNRSKVSFVKFTLRRSRN